MAEGEVEVGWALPRRQVVFVERGTSLDDGARFHGGGPVPRGGKRRGNRPGSVQRELLASLREEGCQSGRLATSPPSSSPFFPRLTVFGMRLMGEKGGWRPVFFFSNGGNWVLTFSGGLVRVMGRLFCGCGSWDEWVWKERGWVRSFEKGGWLIIGRCCLGFWIFWGREFVFLEKMWKDEEIYVYIYVIRLFHGVWISRWWIVQGGLIRRFGGSFQFWEEYWLAWLLKLSILFW